MLANKVSRLSFSALAAVMLAALTLPASPAQADSFAFGYSSGGYYPRHHHRHYHHRHGPSVRYVYVAPPAYYYPPPPRVVYVNPPPPPVYYSAPPVVYQAPQTLSGGPLVGSQSQCREYQSTAIVNGQQVASYGTACRQIDGSWQIVR